MDKSERYMALEPCHILLFSKEIVDNLMRQEVDEQPKLRQIHTFLKSVKMFQILDESELLILTCNVERKQFRRGQYLQSEGVEPPGLVLVVKGLCMLGLKKKGTFTHPSQQMTVLAEIQSG